MMPHTDRLALRDYVEKLIRRIVSECPRRCAGSRDERKAQEILCEEILQHGGSADYPAFRHDTSHNAVIALHFGLAVVAGIARLINPAIALALHVLVGVSYLCDSLKLCHILRRLCPRQESQNLVVTLPATKPLRRRVVLLAHADAAYTGLMFRRSLVKGAREDLYWRPFQFLRKPFLVAMVGMLMVSWHDFSAMTINLFLPWNHAGYVLWHVYFLALFLLNVQVIIRNEVVPGANDNLSACAALPVLAQRLSPRKPDDVELVLVVTGCEEPGTGGALALARQMRKRWDKAKTVVVAVECIGEGEFRIFHEGEILPLKPPRWLVNQAKQVATGDERFSDTTVYALPAGYTDSLAFLVRGYPSICLGRVDREVGTPTRYHLPSDSPDNLDYDRLLDSVDFIEMFVDSLVAPPDAREPVAEARSLPECV